MKKIIFIVTLIILIPVSLWAACSWDGSTGTVASPYAQSDVQDCVNTASAKTGDVTIYIPGSATWTGSGSVSINMTTWAADNVILSGAGASTTVITMERTGGNAFAVTTKDGIGFEVKDMAVVYTDTCVAYAWFMQITGTGGRTSPSTTGINIHNMTFTRSAGLQSANAFLIAPRIYGVMHSNTLTNSRLYMTYSSSALADQDAEWSAAAGLGGDKFLFIEHNTISLAIDALDGYASAKTVTRYNNFVNTYWMSHGGGANSIRGYRAFEVYNNNFAYDGNRPSAVSRPFFIRSGNGVIYDNTMTGTMGTISQYIEVDYELACSQCCFAASYYRTFREEDGYNTKWIAADWATPPACDTYPCQDQLGRGQDTGWGTEQLSEGIYIWGNTTPTGSLTMRLNPSACAATANIIQADRDYFNVASKAAAIAAGLSETYSTYTCPHPLAGEGACDYNVAGTAGYSLGLAPDETPPVISNQTPTGQQACTGDDEEVEIGVTTDEAATCKYDTSDTTYALMANTFSSTGGTTHTQTVTSDCSSSPLYYVRCMDEAENVNTVSAQISYQMASDEDTTPPTLSARALGTDGRTITLTASESIVYGSGGSSGWTVATDAETEISVSYVSGAGTASIVLQTDRIVLSTETITLSYTQPSDGWEDQAGNDLATIEDAAITNGSDHSGASDGTQLWHDDVYTVGGVTADLGSEGAGERGIQFKSSRAGKLTHVKFYKQANDTGTHVVNVWAINGTNLATKTVTGETESGVQTVELDSPVEILPDTYYVVSYFCPTGNLFRTVGYFDAEFTSSTFTVPANGGRVALSSSTRFPTNSQSNNLWLDFEFVPGFEVTTSITGAGGTITGDRAALEDETTTATITLRSGWKASVTGCGGSSSQTGNVVTYTTGAITEDCEITAVASEKQILLVQ